LLSPSPGHDDSSKHINETSVSFYQPTQGNNPEDKSSSKQKYCIKGKTHVSAWIQQECQPVCSSYQQMEILGVDMYQTQQDQLTLWFQ
jgi:hypothetical protein